MGSDTDKEFWDFYRKTEQDEYPPYVFDAQTRDMLMRTHGAFVSFPDDADQETYFYFHTEDRPLISGPPRAYIGFINDAEQNLKHRNYYQALANSLAAIKLNPVGARAYLYNATALWFAGHFDAAAKELNETFKYVTNGSDMFAYYKQLSFIEEDRGNCLTAATCIAAAAQFHKYYFYRPEENDPEELSEDLSKRCGVNIAEAKAHAKEILNGAGIPYFTPEELTQRRIEYGIISGRAADIYTAVIDRRTRKIIIDKAKIALYDNLNVVGFEFMDMNEALAYAGTDGMHKNIGIMPNDNYLAILADAIALEQKGEYRTAYDMFFKAATKNIVALEARIGGAICQIGLKNYKEAERRLDRMFKYIVGDLYAESYYTIYAEAEMKMQNHLTAAACTYMALRFGNTKHEYDTLSILRQLKVDLDAVKRNPELVIENAGIALLTPEELERRKKAFGIV